MLGRRSVSRLVSQLSWAFSWDENLAKACSNSKFQRQRRAGQTPFMFGISCAAKFSRDLNERSRQVNRKWIVVADRIEARIYREKPFELVERVTNDLGREKNRALMTDKPGWSRSKLAQPSSTHSLTGEKNPHEEAAVQFARQLCRFLEQAGQ